MALVWIWFLLSPAYAADAIKIVAFGDSLTAGYGLESSQSLPTLLEETLQKAGHHAIVINAGISGDTTAGGKARVQKVLEFKPDIVILALGANDMLRGINPKTTHSNLDYIIRNLRQSGVIIVFSGMKASLNMGARFAGEFNALYSDLAETHDLIYQPFFLEEVAARPALNQLDGIHPNPEGVAVMVRHLLPYMEEAIELLNKRYKNL